jgi:hypothetical protein
MQASRKLLLVSTLLERSGSKLAYTEDKPDLIGDMEQIHKVDFLWPELPKWGIVAPHSGHQDAQ